MIHTKSHEPHVSTPAFEHSDSFANSSPAHPSLVACCPSSPLRASPGGHGDTAAPADGPGVLPEQASQRLALSASSGQGLGSGGSRGSQGGRKCVQERNLCPARTCQQDTSGPVQLCHQERKGIQTQAPLSRTLSSSDGLSGQWLSRPIRVAVARARGWPEGQRPEECLPESLPGEVRAGGGRRLWSTGYPGRRHSTLSRGCRALWEILGRPP